MIKVIVRDVHRAVCRPCENAPSFPSCRPENNVETRAAQNSDQKRLLRRFNVLGVNRWHESSIPILMRGFVIRRLCLAQPCFPDCHAPSVASYRLEILDGNPAPPAQEVVNDFDQAALQLKRHVARARSQMHVFLDERFRDGGHVLVQ